MVVDRCWGSERPVGKKLTGLQLGEFLKPSSHGFKLATRKGAAGFETPRGPGRKGEDAGRGDEGMRDDQVAMRQWRLT